MHLVQHARRATQHLPVVRRASYDALARQFAAWVPTGHFYSPYPDLEEFDRRAPDLLDVDRPITGIDLREREQLDLAAQLARIATEEQLAFPEHAGPDHRYHFDNASYSWSDGMILHLLLRHLAPSRIIEVGSGFSSAMILDTVDQWLGVDGGEVDVTFIEPYPELVRSLLRSTDAERVDVVESPVQDVDLEVFDTLASGDVLVIDSTHVSKAGSDVNHLFFEVLPRLAAGVWVHVHDIFMPFEYPASWVREGRAWQEAYLLRAFLTFNTGFEIRWFQDLMWKRHREVMVASWPSMSRNSGGALWMQRVS